MNKITLVRGRLYCPDTQALATRSSVRHRTAPHLLHFAGAWAKHRFGVSPSMTCMYKWTCYCLGPFHTPHARGSFAPRARERDRWISRLPCTNYVFVHSYPFSSPSVPRPMGGKYFRVAYSMAGMHSTRSSCCTRRISLATRNYKLIRNQHVSPSMTDETASSPLVLAKAIEFRCTVQKKRKCRLGISYSWGPKRIKLLPRSESSQLVFGRSS